MAENIQLKANIDPEQWELIKNKFDDLDDGALIAKIVEQYSNLLEVTSDIDQDNIITELDEQKKLAESLRKKCKNFASRVKTLEDEAADYEGSIERLKKQNRKLTHVFDQPNPQLHRLLKLIARRWLVQVFR